MPPGRAGKGGAPPSAGKGGAKGAAGAAAGAVGGAAAMDLIDDEDGEDESEAESESEEAQVCWSVVFAFLPVIIEVGMEFAGAAMDAVSGRQHA